MVGGDVNGALLNCTRLQTVSYQQVVLIMVCSEMVRYDALDLLRDRFPSRQRASPSAAERASDSKQCRTGQAEHPLQGIGQRTLLHRNWSRCVLRARAVLQKRCPPERGGAEMQAGPYPCNAMYVYSCGSL